MATYRFDPVDLKQMRLLARLSPGGRIQVMLDARELAVGLIRGRLRRHETDIYEMMVFHYRGFDPELSAGFDETLVETQARALGAEVLELWQLIKEAARREVQRGQS
jgi:hypothetical protein